MPPQRRTEDHRRAWVAVRGREGRREHVRLEHVVGIEEGDELAGGGGDAEVARGGRAALRVGRAVSRRIRASSPAAAAAIEGLASVDPSSTSRSSQSSTVWARTLSIASSDMRLGIEERRDDGDAGHDRRSLLRSAWRQRRASSSPARTRAARSACRTGRGGA